STLTSVQSVAAGGAHTCAIHLEPPTEKLVVCWGNNTFGQMGIGQVNSDSFQVVPSEVFNETGDDFLDDVIAVVAGATHTCVITGDHRVDCWGDNTTGQVGGTDPAPATLPRRVDGLSAATRISAGLAYTCALTNGDVYCWGSNASGQLGSATISATSGMPVKIE